MQVLCLDICGYTCVQRANLESLQSFLDDHPPAHEQQGGVQAAENESVHRKMLALMALDRPAAKPGSRCVFVRA